MAFALVKTTDEGYALAGTTDSFGVAAYTFWLVKTDASGTMQWNKTYVSGVMDEASALVQTADGGYALAGTIEAYNGTTYAWLVKTDVSGNMMWNMTCGGGARAQLLRANKSRKKFLARA